MSVLAPGIIIGGRYRVERELAQGGFGAVYIATHKVTEERVALKVLWPHVLKSKDAVDRFQFEATIAAKISSENIVRVLDAGFDEQQKMPFLVMELLKGKTLEGMVEQEGPLQPLEVVSILAQTANALDKAHTYRDPQGNSRPIIHRDLKPENLFFARRESGEPCIKILDFGIAKVLSDTSKASQEAKGTPLYMSHEQLMGGVIGPSTDVWALGLITFYLLTGKPYWTAASNPDANMNALFAELLTSPIDPPTVRARTLGLQVSWGPAFDTWFARTVSRDASQRFQSAGEAVRELALAFETVESSPDSPILVKARTMMAGRYHLDQSLPPTRASRTPDALEPLAGRSTGGSTRTELPALSHSQGQGVPLHPMPIVYGALGVALLSVVTVAVVLLRPPAAPEPHAAAVASPAAPVQSAAPPVSALPMAVPVGSPSAPLPEVPRTKERHAPAPHPSPSSQQRTALPVPSVPPAQPPSTARVDPLDMR
ncbi:MAG: protein kinase [Polyangiaceae bacterium]|jgi:serine/threonine-protein kinase|nr:protein kinase [Polyangiaceae bacterium]